MTYPSCSCSLFAHQLRRSAEPRGVCVELRIASMTRWKRDTRFSLFRRTWWLWFLLDESSNVAETPTHILKPGFALTGLSASPC